MKNDNREGGGGELKRDGGLLTFFPRKGGGGRGLEREGLIEDSRCATQLSTYFSKYTFALELGSVISET